MLKPRLIPCLLVHQRGLVKTVRFSTPRYVGDPLNVVRIFNEKQADELMVLDIDASRECREPDYRMIANIANECRMPLSYGGGVGSVEQLERVIGLGVEKVCISSAAVDEPDLISTAARRVGSQSVVVVVDVKRTGLLRRFEVVTRNATNRTGRDPSAFVREMTERGAGEIVVNSIDRDGTMEGYDLDLVQRLRAETHLPMTVLGGAASIEDVGGLWRTQGLMGAAAGSMFIFMGRYRAVLINYPTVKERIDVMSQAGFSE